MRLRGIIDSLDTQVERKIKELPHCATTLDRERAEQRIGMFDEQIAEIREALGEGAITYDEADEALARGLFCKDCGERLRDAEAAWAYQGRCPECHARRYGVPPQRSPR
jgi:hypothetical protein